MADRPAATNSRKRVKPGRKRRVAGWWLVGVGALIAVVWIGSLWRMAGMGRGTWTVGVYDGMVFVSQMPASSDRVWFDRNTRTGNGILWRAPPPSTDRAIFRWDLGAATYGSFGGFRVLNICLWPFPVLLWASGGWLVWSGRRARRRAMTGVCLKCGYDLVGLAAGAPCPECGGGGGANVIH